MYGLLWKNYGLTRTQVDGMETRIVRKLLLFENAKGEVERDRLESIKRPSSR